MLASTMHISTNNQPTTHSPTPARQPPTVCETRPCLAVSSSKQQPMVVPSGPNRVPSALSQPHQPPPFPHPKMLY